ncbi:MAG: hypothetical protein ABI925_04140 [Verrucomicrobiota bacterium]
MKSWTRDDAKFSGVDLRLEEIQQPVRHNVAPLLLGTGPPGAHSFAELTLQRSILAHAPPVSA